MKTLHVLIKFLNFKVFKIITYVLIFLRWHTRMLHTLNKKSVAFYGNNR